MHVARTSPGKIDFFPLLRVARAGNGDCAGEDGLRPQVLLAQDPVHRHREAVVALHGQRGRLRRARPTALVVSETAAN